MPQKNLCPNAGCASDLVFLFSIHLILVISMGKGKYITALLHPLIPSLKKKQQHISQVFVQLWLLQPGAGDSHYWMAE